MGLAHNLAIQGHPGITRVVDPQWVRVEVVRDWITSCVNNHMDRFKMLPFSRDQDLIMPRYLVDTLRMCLVKGDQGKGDYFALSYQWDRTETLRNTTLLCQRLLQQYSLSDPEIASKIPTTVKDAFTVVKTLGYRYLWVDAICIVSMLEFLYLMQVEYQAGIWLRYKMTSFGLSPI
ncbi:hypothetical protein PTT_14704 [Pyrenophora teres f. teres 0-1]|uniref:Heterokaryon incompatibility domain-containing protein n=2 Tax=Pyrenophora teres f. teres TaxID=97479 RepID=E3RYR3_PYRTT|nr:hypothetical protein PTT_14704 [Pyrenophora teres f. teres 0-1]CAE6999761.1 HET-domain-containing protein [Pyrenophora teres f. teres]